MPHLPLLPLAQVDPTTPVDLAAVADSGLDDWVRALIIFVVALILAFAARTGINRVGRRRDTVGSTVQIVARLVFAVLVMAGIYMALRRIGVDLAPLVAGAGIVGIALAFALQDVAQNYVSGIMLGFKNPFRPGDVIITGDQEGIVEDLDLRYTVIRGYDGVRILVPNGQVLQNPLVNLTISGARRVEFTVGVAYGTDLDHATEVAANAAASVPGVEPQPRADAIVSELAASWITITVRFWLTPPTTDLLLLRDAVMKAVVRAYDAHGIEIPFEQRVVRAPAGAILATGD